MPLPANPFIPPSLPIGPGTYALIFRLSGAADLPIGRLGTFAFTPGWYAYVGSAHGPGGLRARLSRHLRAGKKCHWHIDWLTAHMPPTAIWLFASRERLECRWAQTLAALEGTEEPVWGFGASDCPCPTHLFRLVAGSLNAAWLSLGQPARFPAHGWPDG